jgi:predicted kinase
MFVDMKRKTGRLAASVIVSGLLGLLSACGGGGDTTSPPSSKTPTLQSIEVTPSLSQAAAGTTAQFAATAIYTDGTHKDVTAEVTWSSSDTGAATISNDAGSNGLARTVGVGSTTIAAASGGVSGSTTLAVTPAVLVSIGVTPASPSVAKGLTRQFTAIGVFSDNSTQDLTTQVTWSSSSAAVATVSNAAGSNGLARTVSVGSTTIAAASGGVSGSTTLAVTPAVLVSIGVTPASPSVAKGLTRQFTAIGVFSDNSTQDLTTQMTWSSSDTGVATVSNAAGSNGLATAAAVGSSTIAATSGGVSGSTTLTVTAATLVSVEVTPASPSVAKGLTRQFTATGVFSDNSTQDLTSAVTWSSSDGEVATVSNAAGSNGLATSASVGGSTISATSGGVSGSTTLTVTAATLVSVEVTPASPSVAKGLTRQFTATGVYTDNSTQDLTTAVTWASSDGAVATVSNAAGSNGLATTSSVGTSTVTATSGGVSGSTELTVTAATLVSVEVTPANPSVAKGLAQQFTATGVYTDNSTQDLTTQVTWTSSDTGVATVSNAAGSNGLATTTAVGSSTISATSGGVSGSTELTVTAATLVSVEVTPANPSVAKGLTQQFTATGVYTDNSTQNLTTQVTWSSSDTGVATVSNAAGSNGLATTTAVGSSTISATSGGVSGSTTLAVTPAVLGSVVVAPSAASLPNGFKRQYMATGVFTDNSTQDLTAAVAWVSSNTGVATVSNGAGSQGLATVTGVGTTTISATTIGGIAGNTSLVTQSVAVSGRSNPWNQVVNPTMLYSNDAFPPVVVPLTTLSVAAGAFLNLVCIDGYTNAGGLPNTDCSGLGSPYLPTDSMYQPACGHYYPTVHISPSYYPIRLFQVLGVFADAGGVAVGQPFPISPNTLRVEVPAGAVALQLGMNDCLNSDNSASPLTLLIFN